MRQPVVGGPLMVLAPHWCLTGAKTIPYGCLGFLPQHRPDENYITNTDIAWPKTLVLP